MEYGDSEEGYPPDMFLSLAYKDKLICPICYGVARNYVCCVEKEHFFCRACVEKALVKKRACPCCRTPLTVPLLKKHSWATEAFDKCVVRCLTACGKPKTLPSSTDSSSFSDDETAYKLDSSSSSSSTCQWTGRLKCLDEHMASCPYDLIECPYEGCTWKVHRSDVEFHIATCRYAEYEEAAQWSSTLYRVMSRVLLTCIFCSYVLLFTLHDEINQHQLM
jgi:hypothetical protein